MELSDEKLRILGSLIEKSATTPDHYPLSTNALVAACNQKSNREPAVDYSDREIDQAMLDLRAEGLARTVHAAGQRASKHKHVLDEALDLTDQELAVLGVMMLRGPQSVGELKTRTERYQVFTDIDQIHQTVRHLQMRPEPLVADVGRQPGQRETRFAHLLAGEVVQQAAVTPAQATAQASGQPVRSETQREIDSLKEEVAALRSQIQTIGTQLGLDLGSQDSHLDIS